MATHVPTPYTPLPQPGPTPHARSSRISVWTAARYALIACTTILIVHALLVLVAPDHPYTTSVRSALLRPSSSPVESRPSWPYPKFQGGLPGGFYRDPTPIKTMLGFLDLAEREVQAKGLDTCWDKLGPRFIEEYHSTEMQYCTPESDGGAANARNQSRNRDRNDLPTYITCSAIHRNEFTKWWPYPAAPCLSSNLRMVEGGHREYRSAGCEVTNDGIRLISQMAKENFVGKDTTQVDLDGEEGKCETVIDHTVVMIHRQDQWNPFHVAEDLITTVVTLLLAAINAPDLIEDRIQLVFSEGFGMDQNHFTPLWDRMGAWAPRRLSLDPWGKGVCLSNAIHSVGAGASLLSAMGISNSFKCASSITWAASHYYRHLFGLTPISSSSTSAPAPPRRPINILWLSRAKLDAYAMKHDDWSKWRGVRHLSNEPELLEGIREGIRQFCTSGRCVYQDALENPESWTEDIVNNATTPVRFTSIDPTVHALETQIQYVGHTSILISLHGGALGLSLFLPPGEATIIELQVKEVSGNFHFEHMAYEMGHVYEQLRVERHVNVDMVVKVVKEQLDRIMGNGNIEPVPEAGGEVSSG